MNEIPSSVGVFIYAIIGTIIFTVVPIVRWLIKHSKDKDVKNDQIVMRVDGDDGV